MPTQTVCSRFHEAVELIGARWTGALLRVLLDGRTRYADLRSAVPEISDRMLSERLRELEHARIINRYVSADPPVRVEYELTEKGRALEPSLKAIGEWAERWIEAPAAAAETKGRASKAR